MTEERVSVEVVGVYARVSLCVGDKVYEIDLRPSDAVSLAIRVKCPLYINEDVLGAAAR